MSKAKKPEKRTLLWIFIGILIGVFVIAFVFLYAQIQLQQRSSECEVMCKAKGFGWSICKFSLSEGCYCWKPKLLGLLGYDCVKS